MPRNINDMKRAIKSLNLSESREKLSLFLLLNHMKNICDITVYIERTPQLLKLAKAYNLYILFDYAYGIFKPGAKKFSKIHLNGCVIPSGNIGCMISGVKSKISDYRTLWFMNKKYKYTREIFQREMGEIFDYPRCCIDTYTKNLRRSPGISFAIQKPPLELQILHYVPCSLKCKISLTKGKKIIKFLEKNWPELLSERKKEIKKEPYYAGGMKYVSLKLYKKLSKEWEKRTELK